MFKILFFILLFFYFNNSSNYCYSKDIWCSNLCLKEEYKILCQYKWLFILSTGRSGSTTILKGLNLINNINLIGETNIINELNKLYQLQFNNNNTNGANRNIKYLEELQLLYYIINCPNQNCLNNQILGGKEVHFTIENIYFLRILFPCSRFIFNFRKDSYAQVNSAFHKKKKTSQTELLKLNSQLLEIHKLWKDYSYLMMLEDFSIPQFNNLLLWLNIHGCSFQSIGHFNQNNTYHLSSKPLLIGNCIKTKENSIV